MSDFIEPLDNSSKRQTPDVLEEKELVLPNDSDVVPKEVTRIETPNNQASKIESKSDHLSE